MMEALANSDIADATTDFSRLHEADAIFALRSHPPARPPPRARHELM